MIKNLTVYSYCCDQSFKGIRYVEDPVKGTFEGEKGGRFGAGVADSNLNPLG
jgi:hypothetical protein